MQHLGAVLLCHAVIIPQRDDLPFALGQLLYRGAQCDMLHELFLRAVSALHQFQRKSVLPRFTLEALGVAGLFGNLVRHNASISGAECGCQAEIGVASAMAASAAVELMGGSPEQCLDAASTVLMNMLGLVCDPVGGLVEYPCQNRNAAGVANALIAAELSLSGIRQLIPFDQMLDAMYAVGKRLPAELRETALGGCAATPAACAACGLCSGN